MYNRSLPLFFPSWF